MKSRFRLYRWMFVRHGLIRRWLGLNLVIMVSAFSLMMLADSFLGALEMRWGLTVWMAFIMGVTAVVTVNTALNLLGLGYESVSDTEQKI